MQNDTDLPSHEHLRETLRLEQEMTQAVLAVLAHTGSSGFIGDLMPPVDGCRIFLAVGSKKDILSMLADESEFDVGATGNPDLH